MWKLTRNEIGEALQAGTETRLELMASAGSKERSTGS